MKSKSFQRLIRKSILFILLLSVVLLLGIKLLNIEAKETRVSYQSILIEEADNLESIIKRYYGIDEDYSSIKDEIVRMNHLVSQGDFITAGDYLVIPIYQ